MNNILNASRNNLTLQKEQEQYWTQLCEQLTLLRSEYKVTVKEIAEGLNVSRQSLYNFIKKPETGLRINRSDLIQLWEHITDEYSMVTSVVRRKRKELTENKLDDLLVAAGFLPTSQGLRAQQRETKFIAHSQKRIARPQMSELEKTSIGTGWLNFDCSLLRLNIQRITFPFDGWIYLYRSTDRG